MTVKDSAGASEVRLAGTNVVEGLLRGSRRALVPKELMEAAQGDQPELNTLAAACSSVMPSV
jgi:hypothetical protein